MDECPASADGTRLPQHLGQPQDRSLIFPHCPLEAWDGRVWSGIRHGKDRDTEGSTTLEISALGMAVAYLLVLLAGALGVLWVLVWLFRDTPGALGGTGREGLDGSRSAPPASERGASPRPRSSPNAPSTRPRETTSGRVPIGAPASSAQALRQNYGRAAQRKIGRTEGTNR